MDKKISAKCLPFQPPVTFSLVAWLSADRLNLSDAWLGAGAAFLVLLWVTWIFSLFHSQWIVPRECQ